MHSKEELLSHFGSESPGSTRGLYKLAFIPDEKIARLASATLEENWGRDNYVLKRYLAFFVRIAIERESYCVIGDSVITTAGMLQTRYGTPVYLKFSPNNRPEINPYYLEFVGANPACAALPQHPQLPCWPEINLASEIVIAHEHILGDNVERLSFLSGTKRVAQMCAVSGAIQWSLHRNLHIKQLISWKSKLFCSFIPPKQRGYNKRSGFSRSHTSATKSSSRANSFRAIYGLSLGTYCRSSA